MVLAAATGALRRRDLLALFVLWEAEIKSAVAGVEPTAGDHLIAGVEVESFGAMRVGVTEQGGLPPAEGVVADRDRDRDVDADHADLHFVLEPAGGAAVIGEDRGAVAVGVGVDQVQALAVSVDADHGQHRPEDLLGVDAHAGSNPVEKGWTE